MSWHRVSNKRAKQGKAEENNDINNKNSLRNLPHTLGESNQPRQISHNSYALFPFIFFRSPKFKTVLNQALNATLNAFLPIHYRNLETTPALQELQEMEEHQLQREPSAWWRPEMAGRRLDVRPALHGEISFHATVSHVSPKVSCTWLL